MNSIDLKSILNFSAFRPEPDDPSASWKKRFPAEKTVFFGLGRGALSWRAISRSGTPGDLESVRADPKEILVQSAEHIKPLTERSWCAVSLSTRYVISLETNLSRRSGSEEMLKSNARGVRGGRYERGKRYALTHNPETNSSILLTFDEDQIRKTESIFTEAGFRVGRFCCGAYVLLKHALALTNIVKGSEQPLSTFYVVCCEGAVCALVQDQDRWLELRSRTDVYEEDLTPITDLLAPFHSRLAPDTGITLVCDEPMDGLADRLGKVFINRTVIDLSQPALLATLMTQN